MLRLADTHVSASSAAVKDRVAAQLNVPYDVHHGHLMLSGVHSSGLV